MAIFIATGSGVLLGPGLPAAGVRCALGPAGVKPAADKREGDGATPAGLWPIRRVLYRRDRILEPKTGLETLPIAPDDGWCDAPADPAYNRAVKLPYPASAERLWLESHVYDVIVILGHNDDPPAPGMGSAIFWHLAHEDYRPTAGCVAVSKEAMLAALAAAGPGAALEVRA